MLQKIHVKTNINNCTIYILHGPKKKTIILEKPENNKIK